MSEGIKKVIGIFASVLGMILFLTALTAVTVVYLNSPPEEMKAQPVTVTFEVRKGESAGSAGQRLADEGFIRSRIFWNILCRLNKEHIKSGHFLIDMPASQLAIHKTLVTGRQILERVTVPEGFTLSKTALLFEEAGICPAGEFIACATESPVTARYGIPGGSMEGYLFPDTYFFPRGYPAERTVRAMADNFFSRIGEIDETLAAMPPGELNKTVILASIVEREYRIDEEAPLMAGVFANRLKIGMALQSCATVEYVITEIQGKPHPEILSTRDTEIRDPYNTYIRPGLPPGPICAPGMVALRAAFSPEKSDYLYFRLVDPASGKHYFSKTFDDHIRAGTLYTKGR